MVKNIKNLTAFAGFLIFMLSVVMPGARGEEMPDTGSAPTPYPSAAAFNHQYEYLGEDAHTDDGVSFRPEPADWKKGKKVKVVWNLTTTEEQRFYPHGVYFRLYVDWNHDGDWDDTGEKVIDSFKDKVKNDSVNKFKDSFTVPEHTREGPFWARAWVSYGYPSPESGDISTAFGEVEDYNLLTYDDPTAVTLVSYTARRVDGKILLEWETASEVDNAGFNLYRAKSGGGRYVKINAELIAAIGNATSGASYSFEDTPPHNGNYYYKLEDVDTAGKSTLHGPVNSKETKHSKQGKKTGINLPSDLLLEIEMLSNEF